MGGLFTKRSLTKANISHYIFSNLNCSLSGTRRLARYFLIVNPSPATYLSKTSSSADPSKFQLPHLQWKPITLSLRHRVPTMLVFKTFSEKVTKWLVSSMVCTSVSLQSKHVTFIFCHIYFLTFTASFSQ